MRQDEAFRRAFVSEIHMLGMLKVVQSAEPRWLRLEDELGWSACRTARWRDPRRRGQAAPSRDACSVSSVDTRHFRCGARDSHRNGGPVPGHETPRRPRTTPSPVSKVDAPSGLALVIKLDGVEWDGPQPSEGDLLAAGRFRFRSGRVTLSMLSGVTLIVEGPADLELITIDRVFCRAGTCAPESRKVPRGSSFPAPVRL